MNARGRTFGGRYTLDERVGVGGMAEVYRARDELLGRDVAVKVLSERFSTDRSFIERFRREAQAAAALAHPNIVSLFDYGSDDETPYIVMELIAGQSLDQVIRQESALMPQRAAEIARDVARALERAHGQGLVHRDIKPNNIMFTADGQTKVTDFGIVRALGADAEATMTQTGMVIGTAAYLSPEQAQGRPVDARSDVYSLGCVLYEMLTGRAPFTGETPLAIAYKHVREDPPTPSSANPDVPAALDAVTMKALAKNPDNRYASAKEMGEDLERYLHGERVLATPILASTAAMPAATRSQTQVIDRADVYDDEEDERRSAAPYIVGALLILLLFGLLAWLFARELFAEEVRVPDVVGFDEPDAVTRLEDRGFEIEKERRPSDEEEGTVIRQDPEGGEMAEEGSTVTITISRGPRMVDVPDVVDLKLREARDRIEGEGLEVGEVTQEPTTEVEEGTVLAQSPTEGESVQTGTAVNLTVAAEPEPAEVPNVIGQTQESAEAELTGAGFQVDVTSGESEQPEGTVFAQDPDPETEHPPGTVVTIAISTGPEQQEMPDVTGMPEKDAEDQLKDMKLKVETVEEPCAEAQPPGYVCDQSPEPGEPVSEGDTVTIFVQPGDSALAPLFALAGRAFG